MKKQKKRKKNNKKRNTDHLPYSNTLGCQLGVDGRWFGAAREIPSLVDALAGMDANNRKYALGFFCIKKHRGACTCLTHAPYGRVRVSIHAHGRLLTVLYMHTCVYLYMCTRACWQGCTGTHACDYWRVRAPNVHVGRPTRTFSIAEPGVRVCRWPRVRVPMIFPLAHCRCNITNHEFHAGAHYQVLGNYSQPCQSFCVRFSLENAPSQCHYLSAIVCKIVSLLLIS